nr:uroporphyrinogen decarboxylase [Nanchangia anserum]
MSPTAPPAQPALLCALAGHRPSRPPVWFMRQAGRSLPEYRRVREGIAMLDACVRPDLVAEITCQPVRRHDVDAAIFFSDIMVPLKLAGVDVDIRPGIGPVLAQPPRTAADVRALTTLAPDGLGVIEDAARACIAELGDPTDPEATPLIAFAGAPFTLAAYVVEGRGTRDHLAARTLMHADPEAWDALMTWAGDLAIAFIRAQIRGGATVAQLFDSWAGSLSRADYARYCLPYSARVFSALAADGVPTIHFGTGTGPFLDLLATAGPTCVGVDYRLGLDEAIDRLRAIGRPSPLVVQGNIDPALLSCPTPVLRAHARAVVEAGMGADGHIVNLGHGVPPSTDPDCLSDLVAYIHSLRPGKD